MKLCSYESEGVEKLLCGFKIKLCYEVEKEKPFLQQTLKRELDDETLHAHIDDSDRFLYPSGKHR